LRKPFGAERVASAHAAAVAGIDPALWHRERAPIAGRDDGIEVIIVPTADRLPAGADRSRAAWLSRGPARRHL
jgi:hypothetical protein